MIAIITFITFYLVVEAGIWVNFHNHARVPYLIHSTWMNRVCKYTMLAYCVLSSGSMLSFFLGIVGFILLAVNTFFAVRIKHGVELLEQYANGEISYIDINDTQEE